MNKKKTLTLAVGFCLILLGVYFLSRALIYQRSLNIALDMMEKALFYSQELIDLINRLQSLIPVYTVIGIAFIALGSIILASALWLLPRLKVLLALLLISIVVINPAFALSSATQIRWFATVDLVQPRNMWAIKGNIHLFDNTLDSIQERPYVNFRLSVIRADDYYGYYEEIQIGYFQNRSGFWVYAEANTLDGYALVVWQQLDLSGANGEGYIVVSLVEGGSNTFSAVYEECVSPSSNFLPIDPGGGGTILTATFQLNEDSLFKAGSESTSPYNSLNGFYSDLVYYQHDCWQIWQNVNQRADSPYRIQMGSTNEFHTLGGLTRPTAGGRGAWGFLAPDERP